MRRHFSTKVRDYRLKRGWTQEELGRAAGLARSFVNMIERKQMSVTIETIAAIANALEIPAAALIDGPADTKGEREPRSVRPSQRGSGRSDADAEASEHHDLRHDS